MSGSKDEAVAMLDGTGPADRDPDLRALIEAWGAWPETAETAATIRRLIPACKVRYGTHLQQLVTGRAPPKRGRKRGT